MVDYEERDEFGSASALRAARFLLLLLERDAHLSGSTESSEPDGSSLLTEKLSSLLSGDRCVKGREVERERSARRVEERRGRAETSSRARRKAKETNLRGGK